MSDDLVKRLREDQPVTQDMASTMQCALQDEAADRIEELEAKNARLETEAKIQAEEIDKTHRRADKWQSMVLDCEEYLKFGETPVERIEREINDCLALMKLLEKKQSRIDDLEAKLSKSEALLAKAVGALDVDLIEQAISDVLSEGGTIRDAAEYVARTTLAELKGEK